MSDSDACRICGAATVDVGSKKGTLRPTEFQLRHCPACRYSFIANPWTDYAAIYSADYYAGRGADPLVDYVFELDHPEATIRQYEWRGILRIVEALVTIGAETRWLDFGCGNGGLVRYVRAERPCHAVGFEEGWIKDEAARRGIPFVEADKLDELRGTFDVVTAIEVLEHVADPVAVLKQVRGLLKPGGLFFLTTGNARPFRDRLLSWQYVRPEIHVSFFEPETLARALTLAGFRPEYRGYLPGFTDVIKFKVLKNLGARRLALAQKLLPWGVLSRVVNRRFQVAGHPVGWAA